MPSLIRPGDVVTVKDHVLSDSTVFAEVESVEGSTAFIVRRHYARGVAGTKYEDREPVPVSMLQKWVRSE